MKVANAAGLTAGTQPLRNNGSMPTLKMLSRYLLGLLFVAAGINHFWHTPFYVAMMPPYLPAPLALVYFSGVAEIGLG
ncbi:MAG: hypothetical protein B7X59_08605, partial [Polaromonas sp. 39-63-203]